jgi:hypothetical protein
LTDSNELEAYSFRRPNAGDDLDGLNLEVSLGEELGLVWRQTAVRVRIKRKQRQFCRLQ